MKEKEKPEGAGRDAKDSVYVIFNNDKTKKIIPMLDNIIHNILGCTTTTNTEELYTLNELTEICLRSRELMLEENSMVEIKPPVFVFGDLHGQLQDLQKMLTLVGPPPLHRLLFLGDYVDRGAFSLETITLLLAYKLRYPRCVQLLRGNHETRCVNRQYGFYDECKRKFPNDGIELWTHYQHVFNCLPLAARIGKRIFCAHGGISEDLCTFQQFERGIGGISMMFSSYVSGYYGFIKWAFRISRPTDICDLGVLCDLVWSDPSNVTERYSPSPRGVSQIFGKQAVADFCSWLNIDLICRAHQCVQDGYELFCNMKLITIFSAPCYCGEIDNLAGILHVSSNLECRILTYRSERKAVKPRPGQGLSSPSGTGTAGGPVVDHYGPITKVVDELNSLYDLGRCKSLTRTLYMLATASCATDEDALSVDNFVSSRLPTRTKLFFDGFIQLTKKKGIKFAETLQIEQVKFHPEGLHYVCHLAAITKQTEVLDSLLQLRVLFQLTEKSALIVYDNLIKIVGKKGDLDELSRIGQEILDQRWKEDFLPSLSRIRHFYICKNQVPPKHIQDFLDSKGK